MASLGQLFGFGKAKTPDFGNLPRPMGSITESVMYKPVVEGVGGIKEALARRGTGYTQDLFNADQAAWGDIGRTELAKAQTDINARSSAGGLGRSSVNAAQNQQVALENAQRLAGRAADIRRASQDQEIAQQQQARGLGSGLIGTDISASQGKAQFEGDLALKQLGIERENEAQQLAGLGRLVAVASPVVKGAVGQVGGFLGGVPGLSGLGGFMKDISTDFGAQVARADNDDIQDILDKYLKYKNTLGR